MIRIAHVTATFPPYRGGTGNVCYHNARELARRGYDVHVYTAEVAGAPAREERDGIHIHRLHSLVRIGNAPLLPGLLRGLRGFDIIHLHFPFILGAEMARVASIVDRTPMLVSFHNDLIGDGARASLFSIYQRLSGILTVRTATCLCAVSLDHYETSLLRRVLKPDHPPVTELPNGVDTALFSPLGDRTELRNRYKIPVDARLVLFVAALDRAHHFKGLERLLNVLRLLPSNVWLLIVGDGDMKSVYERQVKELGVSSRTVFAGSIDHEETPQFFRNADVTVLPSSPPESFGLVLIESMACGTPVVASDIPGVRKVIDHMQNGILTESAAPAMLARSIQRILDDKLLYAEMAQQGRAKVEARYSWASVGAQLDALYQRVLAGVPVATSTSDQGGG